MKNLMCNTNTQYIVCTAVPQLWDFQIEVVPSWQVTFNIF